MWLENAEKIMLGYSGPKFSEIGTDGNLLCELTGVARSTVYVSRLAAKPDEQALHAV